MWQLDWNYISFNISGHLGRSHEGKILLSESHSARLHEILNDMGKSIHNLPAQLKVRALNCLGALFQSEPADATNNQIISITEQWFTSLTGDNQLTFVQEFCRNPFPELRMAAFGLLRAVCNYSWGQRALSNTAGFIEFLLNRNTEVDKDILYEKYNVLKAVANSSEFDEITRRQIRKYINDGVFYVQGVMEVAIEGS